MYSRLEEWTQLAPCFQLIWLFLFLFFFFFLSIVLFWEIDESSQLIIIKKKNHFISGERRNLNSVLIYWVREIWILILLIKKIRQY